MRKQEKWQMTVKHGQVTYDPQGRWQEIIELGYTNGVRSFGPPGNLYLIGIGWDHTYIGYVVKREWGNFTEALDDQRRGILSMAHALADDIIGWRFVYAEDRATVLRTFNDGRTEDAARATEITGRRGWLKESRARRAEYEAARAAAA